MIVDYIPKEVLCGEKGWSEEEYATYKSMKRLAVESLGYKHYKEIQDEATKEFKALTTPKKPVLREGKTFMSFCYDDDGGTDIDSIFLADWICPNCGMFVGQRFNYKDTRKSNYCRECGQAILWEKECEDEDE